MQENPFNITREEILNLAAQKVADAYCDLGEVGHMVETRLKERIDLAFKSTLKDRIDAMLTKELEILMTKEIVPVDIWGSQTGDPTTIRAQLVKRAQAFWSESVSEDGRPSSYGGKPRHEWMFAKVANDAFGNALKQDVVNVIGALKDAVKSDLYSAVSKHVDELIRVKTQKDSAR